MSIKFVVISINFRRVRFLSTFRMSTEKCLVGVCQLTSTNNKENNLKIVKELVSDCAKRNAKVVFLPEACDYIATSKEEAKAFAEPLTGTLMNEYRNLAKSKNVWLSVGGFHELTRINNEYKIFNSHVLIDHNGDIQAVYKKIHLFDICIPEANLSLRESENYEAGKEIVPPVVTPAGPLSLAICYDLRFPELAVLQRKQGASILTYPSAFTNTTGLLHWEVLLRARAIENQCYVVAAAQYGKHNEKRTSFGQALIVDPLGRMLVGCPKYREGMETNHSFAIAEIDFQLIDKVRREMPNFEHRRDDIYQLQAIDDPKFPLDENDIYNFADKTILGNTVFYRTEYTFAFTNIRCVVPGHVLVAPLRCSRRLDDLTAIELSDLFKTAVKVQKALETVHSADSSTLCVQDGKNAGQTVPHVHIHILPRKANDFEYNDEVYDKLASHDREDSQTPLRGDREMQREAAVLRKYFY